MLASSIHQQQGVRWREVDPSGIQMNGIQSNGVQTTGFI